MNSGEKQRGIKKLRGCLGFIKKAAEKDQDEHSFQGYTIGRDNIEKI